MDPYGEEEPRRRTLPPKRESNEGPYGEVGASAPKDTAPAPPRREGKGQRRPVPAGETLAGGGGVGGAGVGRDGGANGSGGADAYGGDVEGGGARSGGLSGGSIGGSGMERGESGAGALVTAPTTSRSGAERRVGFSGSVDRTPTVGWGTRAGAPRAEVERDDLDESGALSGSEGRWRALESSVALHTSSSGVLGRSGPVVGVSEANFASHGAGGVIAPGRSSRGMPLPDASDARAFGTGARPSYARTARPYASEPPSPLVGGGVRVGGVGGGAGSASSSAGPGVGGVSGSGGVGGGVGGVGGVGGGGGGVGGTGLVRVAGMGSGAMSTTTVEGREVLMATAEAGGRVYVESIATGDYVRVRPSRDPQDAAAGAKSGGEGEAGGALGDSGVDEWGSFLAPYRPWFVACFLASEGVAAGMTIVLAAAASEHSLISDASLVSALHPVGGGVRAVTMVLTTLGWVATARAVDLWSMGSRTELMEEHSDLGQARDADSSSSSSSSGALAGGGGLSDGLALGDPSPPPLHASAALAGPSPSSAAGTPGGTSAPVPPGQRGAAAENLCAAVLQQPALWAALLFYSLAIALQWAVLPYEARLLAEGAPALQPGGAWSTWAAVHIVRALCLSFAWLIRAVSVASAAEQLTLTRHALAAHRTALFNARRQIERIVLSMHALEPQPAAPTSAAPNNSSSAAAAAAAAAAPPSTAAVFQTTLTVRQAARIALRATADRTLNNLVATEFARARS